MDKIQEIFGDVKPHQHWLTKSKAELSESLLDYLLKNSDSIPFPRQWDHIYNWMVGMENGFVEAQQ